MCGKKILPMFHVFRLWWNLLSHSRAEDRQPPPRARSVGFSDRQIRQSGQTLNLRIHTSICSRGGGGEPTGQSSGSRFRPTRSLVHLESPVFPGLTATNRDRYITSNRRLSMRALMPIRPTDPGHDQYPVSEISGKANSQETATLPFGVLFVLTKHPILFDKFLH